MPLLPLALALSLNLTASPSPAPALASLVDAEYGFAEQVEKQGSRSGFLGVLRNDGLVFIPRPVSGLAYYQTRLEQGERLSSYPAAGLASQAGDLAYGTGPWVLRPGQGGPDAHDQHGWYVNLWQREGAGPWRLRLQIGIPTPDPADLPVPAPLPRASAALPPVAPGRGNPAELMDLDRAFGRDAAKDPTAAYLARLDDQVRFYRKGRFPVTGPRSLGAALDPGPVSWEPAEAFMAASGDLGCTRGTLEHQSPDGRSIAKYVRMWRKQGPAWKLVLDLELALGAQ